MHQQSFAVRLAPLMLMLATLACGEPPQDPTELADPPDTAAPTEDDFAEEATPHTQALTAKQTRRVPLVTQLEAATEGLLFMSESDYPLEVLYWKRPGGRPTADRVAALTGHTGEPVEERTLQAFFRGATATYPEQPEEERAIAERYQALERLLRKKLSHIKVFRFGHIQIHSYVVGVTTSGAWAGVATIQIET